MTKGKRTKGEMTGEGDEGKEEENYVDIKTHQICFNKITSFGHSRKCISLFCCLFKINVTEEEEKGIQTLISMHLFLVFILICNLRFVTIGSYIFKYQR
jgi:hypothetical protein